MSKHRDSTSLYRSINFQIQVNFLKKYHQGILRAKIDPAADALEPSVGRVARGGALGQGGSILGVLEKWSSSFHHTTGREPRRPLRDRSHDPLSKPGGAAQSVRGDTRRGRWDRQLPRPHTQNHGCLQAIPRWSPTCLLSPCCFKKELCLRQNRLRARGTQETQARHHWGTSTAARALQVKNHF